MRDRPAWARSSGSCEEHPGEVAAVVVEPLVQGAAGMIVHPEGYLRGLRELTRRHGTLLIADEVAVGFGRTGTLFACEQEGVSPDFLCLAKGLTGGYLPMAATLTTEEVYSAFYGTAAEGKTFYHGHTYGGNPLGAAVALANLAGLRRGADPREPRAPRSPGSAERLAEVAAPPARRRRPPEGPDRRDRAGRGQGDEGAVPLGPTRSAPGSAGGPATSGLLIRPLGDVIVVMPPLAITGRATRLDGRRGDRCIRGSVTEDSERRWMDVDEPARPVRGRDRHGRGQDLRGVGDRPDLDGDGPRVGVLKPVGLGGRRPRRRLWSSDDAERLIEAVGGGIPVERVAPDRLRGAAGPAASPPDGRGRRSSRPRSSGRSPRPSAWWADRAEVMVVEGVGGLLCPLAEGTTVADLAVGSIIRCWSWPSGAWGR